jgi:guanylate kinase
MYDYIVVNDTVENAADKIMAIIRAEHAKTERTINSYNSQILEKSGIDCDN